MSNSIMPIDWSCNVLGDLFSVYVALLGCLVSVFTLLYSFIISKKDDLKMYADLQAHGDKSPSIIQRQHFATNYIKRMRNALNLCLILILCSTFLSIACWIGERILVGRAQIIMLCIIGGLTLIYCIIIVVLCLRVIRQYRNDIII